MGQLARHVFRHYQPKRFLPQRRDEHHICAVIAGDQFMPGDFTVKRHCPDELFFAKQGLQFVNLHLAAADKKCAGEMATRRFLILLVLLPAGRALTLLMLQSPGQEVQVEPAPKAAFSPAWQLILPACHRQVLILLFQDVVSWLV
jgi:hypothetical protein